MKPSPAFSPSAGLMQFAQAFAGKLVLDAPCGNGRNAIALARMDCTIVGSDHDQQRLDVAASAAKQAGIASPRIALVRCDLSERGWCFRNEGFDGIVCVHFDFRPILGQLLTTVRPSGYLYIETFGGQGRNYLDLPPEGFVKEMLSGDFEIKSYNERRVGPAGVDAVAVQTFCRRRHRP